MKGEGPSDLPLGIFEDGRYAETEITLDPGDLVLFHTDALTESRDQSGNLIGSKGFLELVSAIEQPGSSQWLDAIVHRIKSLNSNNLTEDDFTLLLFCATGEANRISLGRRLLAPFRLLQGIAASIAEGGRGMPLPDFTSKSLTDGSNRPNRP